MAKEAINFIQKRKLEFPRRFMSFFAFRANPQVLMGAFLVLAGLGAGAFYLMKFQNVGPFAEKPKTEAQVAGITCEPGKLPKDWVQKYWGTENECDPRVGGAEGDPDDDFLKNQEEYLFGTNPTNHDTDGDGLYDGQEIAFNYDPKGPGRLEISQQTAEEYLKSLGPEFQKYSEENIGKQIENLFQPNREIILDIPDTKELILTQDNQLSGFEKYYNETEGLGGGEAREIAELSESLFELTPEELNHYIDKLQAIQKVLKEIPVPSEVAIISQLRIARYRAGVKIFELIRDEYVSDTANTQFWQNYFYQSVVANQAKTLETLTWRELGRQLKERGEL